MTTDITSAGRALVEQWRAKARHVRQLAVTSKYDAEESGRLLECAACREACADQLSALLADAPTRGEQWREYAQHKEDCDSWQCVICRCGSGADDAIHRHGYGVHHFEPKPCTCGLSALLAQAQFVDRSLECHQENCVEGLEATTGKSLVSMPNVEPAEPLLDGVKAEAALDTHSTNLSVRTNAIEKTGKPHATSEALLAQAGAPDDIRQRWEGTCRELEQIRGLVNASGCHGDYSEESTVDAVRRVVAQAGAPRCQNCDHVEPHTGPAGDVADACTHPMCNCGFDSRPTGEAGSLQDKQEKRIHQAIITWLGPQYDEHREMGSSNPDYHSPENVEDLLNAIMKELTYGQ